MSSWYHNVKLDKISSYLPTFACQYGRYRYKRLPFKATPTWDMFQCKFDEIFKDLPNVFVIPDILVVGYDSDGKDFDETVRQVLQIGRQENLKLKKDKSHFRCMSVSFFGEVIPRHGVMTCTHTHLK